MAITIDKIEPIIHSIIERREQEIEKIVFHPAFCRLDAVEDGNKRVFWIVLAWNSSNDVIGDEKENNTISRDSKLGGLLIQNYPGRYSHAVPGGIVEVDIFNRTKYVPCLDDEGMAKDIILNFVDDHNSYQYRNLNIIFEELSSLNKNIEETKKALKKEESKELEEKLEKLETEQQNYLDNAQAFIRQNAELRWQPVLDPDQELIKRSKIFDSGTLIINGGPGTGKTTSLIQRIKFLISPTIDESKPLTKTQKELLFNGNSSWIFYSPSDLLALYLKDSMAKEELAADTKKVRVWKKHRSELIKLYRLYDVDTKGNPSPNSFLFYSSNETCLYSSKSECIKKIKDGFTEYFINLHKQNIKKIISMPTHTREEYLNIITDFKKKENVYITEILEEELCKNCESIGMNTSYFKAMLKKAIKSDENSFGDKAVQTTKFFIAKFGFIKNHINKNSDCKNIDELIQLYYFLNENYSRGFAARLFNTIPKIYKAFRKMQLNKKNSFWNIELLENTVNDKNQKLHSDEQSFLLYFINSVCYKIAQNSQMYNDIKHPYIDAYKSNCKPVIAIDEATDFSLLELLAMNSLRHPLFSSVTLSGDLMQRMTTEGLKSWQDYSDIQTSTEVKDLTKSYRQSPTLLSLAQAIYQKSTGEKAAYISYMVPDPSEPKPLMKITGNNNEKVNWIAERIREISKIYMDSVGNIPSIAVFVPDEADVDVFADALNNILLGNIPVSPCKDGKVLGEASDIRVFAIDKIKGLEFEAAFFHNLDDLSELKEDLLLKYLYVGLSRATFYLGVTLTKELNEFKFIEDKFDKNGNWELPTQKYQAPK
ncbi:hypothetical protein FACS1894163_09250 [Spirochaetia bacterium]|nr:hypothetical protein FACS1894163_09250 [Spirochaetia bacterium]